MNIAADMVMNAEGSPAAGFARRAEALHAHGESTEALRLLTAGTRRFPGDVTALLVLARVCRDTGREDEARAWIDQALRLDPACPAALMFFGTPTVSASSDTPDTSDTQAGATPTARDAFAPVAQPTARIVRREPAQAVPSPFAFPVREEDEEPEIEEDSAPHVATVTLAEIYLQQGLKEQAAQIYRQLVERQPDDEAAQKRLQEILREIEES